MSIHQNASSNWTFESNDSMIYHSTVTATLYLQLSETPLLSSAIGIVSNVSTAAAALLTDTDDTTIDALDDEDGYPVPPNRYGGLTDFLPAICVGIALALTITFVAIIRRVRLRYRAVRGQPNQTFSVLATRIQSRDQRMTPSHNSSPEELGTRAGREPPPPVTTRPASPGDTRSILSSQPTLHLNSPGNRQVSAPVDGLNEFGEAPPPYVPVVEGEHATIRGEEAIELEGVNQKAPDYDSIEGEIPYPNTTSLSANGSERHTIDTNGDHQDLRATRNDAT